MDNQSNFQQTMLKISEVYSRELTPVALGVYWEALGGVKPEHLAKALNLHLADPVDGKWPPKPAHLIGYIQDMVAREKSKAAYIAQQNQLPHTPPSEEDRARVHAMLKELKS